MTNEIGSTSKGSEDDSRKADPLDELLLLVPEGNTVGLRKRDVCAAFEFLNLNNEPWIAVITAFGAYLAPASEPSRNRLRALGFSVARVLIGQDERGIDDFAAALGISLIELDDEETDRLKKEHLTFTALQVKDAAEVQCYLVAWDGQAWWFENSSENYEQLKRWRFYFEEVKPKAPGPKI